LAFFRVLTRFKKLMNARIGKVRKLNIARKNARNIKKKDPAKANPAPGPTYAARGCNNINSKSI